MRHALNVIAIVLLLASCVRPAAAVTETYLFRDSFAPEEGAGNVLVPVSNASGTIVSSGPDFINGSFVTESISAAACASTPSVRAWSFLNKSGLYYPNATPTVVTGSYTISMLMRYDPMNSGYARLIDFSNSTLDSGIYKLGNEVSFYPVGTFAAGSFVQGQDVFVTITRDASTQLVSLYINGVPSGTYTDTTNLYAPSATVVYFLMDNTTGPANISETNPGTIAYLQIRDVPITAEEVTASLATICEVVSATTTTTTSTSTTTSTTHTTTSSTTTSTTTTTTTSTTTSTTHTTTTSTTTTTTTTSPPTTSSTTTTSTTTSSSTTTTHVPTTTTTLPAGDCGSEPVAASFASIDCRLVALLAQVTTTESDLGASGPKLVQNLSKAKAAEEAGASACAASDLKHARQGLKQAIGDMVEYAHHLQTLRARKKLPGALRTDLLDAGNPITDDAKSLKRTVQCPADAPR